MNKVIKSVFRFVVCFVALFAVCQAIFNESDVNAAGHTNAQNIPADNAILYMKDAAGNKVSFDDNEMISFELHPLDGDATKMHFAIMNEWGGKGYRGYFDVYLPGAGTNSAGVYCYEIAGDTGWYQVYVDLSKGTAHSLTGSKLNDIYVTIDNSSKNFQVDNFKGYGSVTSFDKSANAEIVTSDISSYDGVSITYKLFESSGKIALCYGPNSLSNYFGYFDLKGTYASVNNYNGVSYEDLGNGEIKVTFLFNNVTKNSGSSPTVFEKFYIRGNWSTSAGFVKNFTPFNLEEISMDAGAQIRVSKPSGLKFTASIPSVKYDISKQYGMIIIPYQILTATEITNNYHESLNDLGINFLDIHCDPYEDDNGNYKISAAIVNMYLQNYTREFAPIAYMYDGENYTYTTINYSENVRTVKGVAEACKANETYWNSLDSTQQDYINEYITPGDGEEVSNTKSYTGEVVGGAAYANEVIEFYYKTISGTESFQFAVIGVGEGNWDNYFGYFKIQQTNNGNDYSLDDGIQIINNKVTGWNKVVICLNKLNVRVGSTAYERYDAVFFSQNKMNNRVIQVKNFSKRTATIEDMAYFMSSNNDATIFDKTFANAITNEGHGIEFYCKPLTDASSSVLKIWVKPTGEYVEINVSTLTTNKSYATVTKVTEGEYKGWYKVVVNKSGVTGDYTGFYMRYNVGDFFVGGFKACD